MTRAELLRLDGFELLQAVIELAGVPGVEQTPIIRVVAELHSLDVGFAITGFTWMFVEDLADLRPTLREWGLAELADFADDLVGIDLAADDAVDAMAERYRRIGWQHGVIPYLDAHREEITTTEFDLAWLRPRSYVFSY